MEESPERGSIIALGYFIEKKYLHSPSQRARNENRPFFNERATETVSLPNEGGDEVRLRAGVSCTHAQNHY